MMKRNNNTQGGFTLVEIIIVIVITGIIGGIVAMFIQAPVKQYVDIGRRAEMTDIADTAMRRMARDLRLALPNSARVSVVGGVTYLEFIPTVGGGRYRVQQNCAAPPCVGDVLNFPPDGADVSFDVIGPMPPAFTGGNESIVVYNLGTPAADAYAGTNRTTTAVAQVGNNITIAGAGMLFPFDSCQNDPVTGLRGGCRFQVITTPVTYVCAPAAGGAGGTLTRYWGYPITAAQPTAVGAAPLAGAANAILANNVSGCAITYTGNVVASRSGLVTMSLSITEANAAGDAETVTLYGATHVTNVP
jgi:MSHA biogenesis protein MshO